MGVDLRFTLTLKRVRVGFGGRIGRTTDCQEFEFSPSRGGVARKWLRLNEVFLDGLEFVLDGMSASWYRGVRGD